MKFKKIRGERAFRCTWTEYYHGSLKNLSIRIQFVTEEDKKADDWINYPMNLSDWFEYVYANPIQQLLPAIDLFPWKPSKNSDSYIIPVILSVEHGFTYKPKPWWDLS